MKPTENLSRFVVELTFESLPKSVVHQAKNAIMDSLGCGIAGYTLEKETLRAIMDVIIDLNGKKESTVFVSGFKTSCVNAAFANGCLIHSIDFDDTLREPLIHAGSIVVPTSFALGEKLQSSGKDIITAIVAGYEAAARVGESVMPTHYQYWHSTGTNGTFGAVAAAGKLLNLNVEDLNQAIGIAADQASGLISCMEFGDLTKSLHSGFAAMKGVLAALTVKCGGSGPRNILEYAKGYCYAYSENPKIEEITRDLGKQFKIMSNCFKLFPSVLASHPAIEALLKILKENKIKAVDIAKINEKTYKIAATTFCNYNPATILAARLSIPYCIAVASLYGDVGIEQFKKEMVFSGEVREFMKKISVEEDPELTALYPHKFPANVEMVTKDGRKFKESVFYPKGFPENPASDKELRKKFTRLASMVFDQERVLQILKRIAHLEDLTSISELIELLVT